MKEVTRRQMLAQSAAGLVATSSGRSFAADTPAFKVDEIRTISLQNERYHGWPTLVRRSNGELLVVCSGGRESHVCPFGRVELIRSYDDGATWTFARTLLDGPSDDRDAGILETPKGTLLATTFTSLAYEPIFNRALEAAGTSKPQMTASQLARWQAAHERLNAEQRTKQLGCWMIRSEDGGSNWSPAYRVPVNSPHGPIALADGRLFYAGAALWTDERLVQACVSEDDGLTWRVISTIPARDGDDAKAYHELHAVETNSGRLIVHIRNHNTKNAGETLQTVSDDGGKTWTTPRSIGVWGLPSHLLRLNDGRILMSYGHRRQPLGNQARISRDDGTTWSEPIIIQGDATSSDLGYPSTAEITPGRLVTVWYEKIKENPKAVLRMAKWRLS